MAERCGGVLGDTGLQVMAHMTPAGSQLLYLVMKLCEVCLLQSNTTCPGTFHEKRRTKAGMMDKPAVGRRSPEPQNLGWSLPSCRLCPPRTAAELCSARWTHCFLNLERGGSTRQHHSGWVKSDREASK